MTRIFYRLITGMIAVSFLSALLAACAAPPAQPTASTKLQVTATTSIVADIVRQVGGEYVVVDAIVPIGADDHQYQPTPQDVAKVANSTIVFENGLGLETFMDQLVQNAGGKAKIISVSDGITPQSSSSDVHSPDATPSNQAGDPHVWTDPNNVMIWVKNIETALSEADPAHARQYAANAQTALDSLAALDKWIKTQVAVIPADERKMITDHLIFGYFCSRYGFDQVGAIVPSYSTSSEPSAQDIAALEDAIRNYQVKAIFLGQNVNSSLAQRVAGDTGIALVQIYTGSLTNSSGPAATYQDYMRFDVNAIVLGLTGNSGSK